MTATILASVLPFLVYFPKCPSTFLEANVSCPRFELELRPFVHRFVQAFRDPEVACIVCSAQRWHGEARVQGSYTKAKRA